VQSILTQRVHELVNLGWEPKTSTETTASLVGRRPFNWWLFLLVIFFFPVVGGVLYLIFWTVTSQATVFLHVEGDKVATAGDSWLISLHEAQSARDKERRQEIKARGFLAVMWPQLLFSLVLIVIWVLILKRYF
jgi:hypothetical protein